MIRLHGQPQTSLATTQSGYGLLAITLIVGAAGAFSQLLGSVR